MKKALLFSVVAVFAATVVSAEVVESISFNPSRMGKYKQLKVKSIYKNFETKF